MRCFFVILDGLGDRGYGIFNGKTPLKEAYTPNLDYIARNGACGLYHPLKVGLSLPSELAHFFMFGYEVEEFPGRGIVEALGLGLEIKKDNVVLMGRFLEVKNEHGNLIVVEEKPNISDEYANDLINYIGEIHIDGIDFKIYPVKGSFCLIVLSHGSRFVSDSNPILRGYPLFEVQPLKNHLDYRTQQTANAINKFLKYVHKKLSSKSKCKEKLNKDSYINAIATQRAGKFTKLKKFHDKWGLKGISISSSAIFKGLGKLIDMDTIIVKDGKDVQLDLQNKMEIALELKEYDFLHIHTKAPDEAAHTKDPMVKKKVIETLDKAFDFVIQNILTDDNNLLVVTADHSTPSMGKMIHSGESVPLVFSGKGVRVDDVKNFDEISCSLGSMGLLRKHELMYMIINLMDKGRLIGLCDCEDPPYYFPGPYKALSIGDEV